MVGGMEGEQIGLLQRLRRRPMGTPAVVEERVLDGLLVAIYRKGAAHARGRGPDRAKEVIDVARRVAGAGQFQLHQTAAALGDHRHRAGALRDFGAGAGVVARHVGADDQAAVVAAVAQGEQRVDAQQGVGAPGAGVLRLEGGDGLRDREPGGAQHAADVGRDRLGHVGGRFGTHGDVAQAGDGAVVHARQELHRRLRGHGDRVLPEVGEAHRDLPGLVDGAVQDALDGGVGEGVTLQQTAQPHQQLGDVDGHVADTSIHVRILRVRRLRREVGGSRMLSRARVRQGPLPPLAAPLASAACGYILLGSSRAVERSSSVGVYLIGSSGNSVVGSDGR